MNHKEATLSQNTNRDLIVWMKSDHHKSGQADTTRWNNTAPCKSALLESNQIDSSRIKYNEAHSLNCFQIIKHQTNQNMLEVSLNNSQQVCVCVCSFILKNVRDAMRLRPASSTSSSSSSESSLLRFVPFAFAFAFAAACSFMISVKSPMLSQACANVACIKFISSSYRYTLRILSKHPRPREEKTYECVQAIVYSYVILSQIFENTLKTIKSAFLVPPNDAAGFRIVGVVGSCIFSYFSRGVLGGGDMAADGLLMSCGAATAAAGFFMVAAAGFLIIPDAAAAGDDVASGDFCSPAVDPCGDLRAADPPGERVPGDLPAFDPACERVGVLNPSSVSDNGAPSNPSKVSSSRRGMAMAKCCDCKADN
jgi:hypothetical protein